MVLNLLDIFLQSVGRLRHRPCFRYYKDNSWKTLSWLEAADLVREIAMGLKSRGVKKGDRIAILSATRYEWTLCDLAILSLGGVTVPIYPSVTAEQVAFILEDSGARAVFVENKAQALKVQSVRDKLPELKEIIPIEGSPGIDGSLGELRQAGVNESEAEWEEGISRIKSSEIATIVYTSGTTGPPKGAVLTHNNFMSEVESLTKILNLCERHTGLIFLPLAHILARVVQFWQLRSGCVHAYGRGLNMLMSDVQVVHPHFFVSVPRIFEKIHEQVQAKLEAGGRLKKMFLTTVGRGLVHRKIRGLFGRRFRFAVSGGAPLSKDLAEYFHRAGVLVLEGYGLTETTAGIFINSEKAFRFGTVGQSLHGVEKKIAQDGEILIRAPMIFQGYYKNPQATAEALTRDGWFRTGDIGEIDQDGFLRITDRKKDIIVTSAGKNIAPQNIENHLKTSPYISQVMVHGDRRKYLTALITLNRPALKDLLPTEGDRRGESGPLAKHPVVRKVIQRAIEEKNKQLPSYETIKKFVILEDEFTQEAGEVTPTLKLKRKFITQKYQDVINGLYQTSQIKEGEL